MRFIIFFFTASLSGFFSRAQSLPPIGLWREHLPYNSAIDAVQVNDRIFCATPYSLFSVNPDKNTIERFSRVTGLSETGISVIDYDNSNEKLFIAYSNSNIDIIYRNDIINVPDIKRSNIPGDKSIYAIYPFEKNYYLSTGLGIIVIDGERYEVKDSWFIGNNGGHVKVNGFTRSGNFYYAATGEGLKRISIAVNPADYSNWELLTGSNGLATGACQDIFIVQDKLLVQKNDSLYVQNGTDWDLFYADGWPVLNASVTENRIILCQRKFTGESRVVILDPDATISRILSQPAVISFPRKAILVQNEPWVADQFGGLSHFTASSFEQYKPNSPEATASGELTTDGNTFYATAGTVDDAWNYQYNGNGIYILKEGNWTNINRYRFSQLDTLLDYITIAVDPADKSVWAGSFGGGLLHIKAGQSFEIFKQAQFGEAVGDPGSYRVSGLAFDREDNLWITNYGAVQPLLVKKKDGAWMKFSIPFFLTENALSQVLVDDNGYKWMIAPKSGGLICFDDGATIENTADDKWKMLRAGTGNGNLPDGDVLSIAKDKNGFIWVGTTNGIGVIQCPQDIFDAQGCEAVWPVVQQGNFAGYLFNGEEVRDIGVDGADRKWVATKNGVWLVNATGEQVIYQFTQENSPLLSSDVKKLTIDGSTGEVFFATSKGICSFRSTATDGGDKNQNVLVFPNPVPPGYSGTIAIRGLVNNAIVKIVELNGRLVYQTKALGGQAIWDGKNYWGQKISSGVYIVLVDEENTGIGKREKTAARIVFLNK